MFRTDLDGEHVTALREARRAESKRSVAVAIAEVEDFLAEHAVDLRHDLGSVHLDRNRYAPRIHASLADSGRNARHDVDGGS